MTGLHPTGRYESARAGVRLVPAAVAFILLWGAAWAGTGTTMGREAERRPRETDQSLESQPQEGTTRDSAGAAPQSGLTLDWFSLNGGGAVDVGGAGHRLGVSVGQSAAGSGSGTAQRLGVGFWYGAADAPCPIILTGDVNAGGTITAADIILLVNYVFKGGPSPVPCAASGDVNCNGVVNAADIIYEVNYVFKGGPAPCDACTLVPAIWTCP